MSDSAVLLLEDKVEPTFSMPLRHGPSRRIPTEPTSTELALPPQAAVLVDEPTLAAHAGRFASADSATELHRSANMFEDPSRKPLIVRRRPASRRFQKASQVSVLAFAGAAGLIAAMVIVVSFALAALTGLIPPVVAGCFGLGCLFFDISALSLVAAASIR